MSSIRFIFILFWVGAADVGLQSCAGVTGQENLSAPEAYGVVRQIFTTNEPAARTWLCDFVKVKHEVESNNSYYLAGIAQNLQREFGPVKAVAFLTEVRTCLAESRYTRSRQGAEAVMINALSSDFPEQAIKIALENAHQPKGNVLLNLEVIALLNRLQGKPAYVHLLTNYFSDAYSIDDGTRPVGYYAIAASRLANRSGPESFALEQLNHAIDLQTTDTNLYSQLAIEKVEILERLKRFQDVADFLTVVAKQPHNQDQYGEALQNKYKTYLDMGYFGNRATDFALNSGEVVKKRSVKITLIIIFIVSVVPLLLLGKKLLKQKRA